MWKRLGLDHMPWIIVFCPKFLAKTFDQLRVSGFPAMYMDIQGTLSLSYYPAGSSFPLCFARVLPFFHSNLIYKHQRIQNVLPAISAFQFETEFTFLPCGGHRSRKAKKKKSPKNKETDKLFVSFRKNQQVLPHTQVFFWLLTLGDSFSRTSCHRHEFWL